MKWPPTDLKLIQEIYKRYYDDFVSYSEVHDSRVSKNYVPIDIPTLARRFGVDSDVVSGQLYQHLNNRFSAGESHPFFSVKASEDKHVINFPLLCSALAELRAKRNRFLIATWLSVLALIVSVVSLVLSILY